MGLEGGGEGRVGVAGRLRYHEAASLASVVVSVLPCSAAYEAASFEKSASAASGSG